MYMKILDIRIEIYRGEVRTSPIIIKPIDWSYVFRISMFSDTNRTMVEEYRKNSLKKR